jgi:hypothetical protein
MNYYQQVKQREREREREREKNRTTVSKKKKRKDSPIITIIIIITTATAHHSRCQERESKMSGDRGEHSIVPEKRKTNMDGKGAQKTGACAG